MSERDFLQRIVFEDINARAVYVDLDSVVAEVLARESYPDTVAQLLAQALLVVAAMSSGIKFRGRVSLQLQGGGALKRLVADCTDGGGMRAIARLREGAIAPDDTASLWAMLGESGVLTLTLDPCDGGQRWQGIVPLEGRGLDQAIEAYFRRSEQLETRLRLAAADGRARGILIQQMPASSTVLADEDGRNRLEHLLATVAASELLETPGRDLLDRLFHAEQRRVFPARALNFYCPCSRERVMALLGNLGAAELAGLFQIQEVVEVRCQFCNQAYNFAQEDMGELIESAAPGSDSLH
ncbi:MAG: Hsp33 family molecular chaperone HslO [Wenzhouxiangella sp.]|nr:Hsp33 family molecular chaperone HslO [Wenzhouxiangella sp.]